MVLPNACRRAEGHVLDSFHERVAAVRNRIEAACLRAGRAPDSVHLLPVAKTYGPETVMEAAGAGFRCIGENRVQEARQKIPLCPGHLEWHLIGHLQSNKVREAIHYFSMIHSVDSERLLLLIDSAAREEGKTLPVCLEVNVAGEASKYGLSPDEVGPVLEISQKLFNVRVVGLMTVPPAVREPEEVRPWFRALRDLRDRMQIQAGLDLPDLSMGMSGDFEVAVEEGATWVRLGSILFGPRIRPEVPAE
jgi:pyridoxal phosphate enzyme (YggS family)